MRKTILVLPDGRELSSGVGRENAIKSVSITQCVNETQELSVGSACANMAELTVITPHGGFSVGEGDEFALWQVDGAGVRHKVGLFIAEKPVRSGSHSLKITAYDRVSRLDRDLTEWVAGLTGWPYSLYDFVKMTCRQCGLELANGEIPNGPYRVQKFSAQGITGRTIIKWAAQIAGRFCRATPDGLLEFAWYTPAEVCIGAGAPYVRYHADGNVQLYCPPVEVQNQEGAVVLSNLEGVEGKDENVTIALPSSYPTYFSGSLRYCDYQVAPIQKVQIKGADADVGTVYPEDLPQQGNTYVISGNFLLTAADSHTLKAIAQSLYEQLKSVRYTPCSVKIPASFQIQAGNTVQITDANGVTITAYVMTKKQSGQADTLQCTGSASRQNTYAVNHVSYEALSGKVMQLHATVDGLRLENRDAEGKMAALSLDVEGISSQVHRQQADMQGVHQRLTQLQQNEASVALRVKQVEEEGVRQVTTETGFTFDKKGLTISRSDTQMENLLNETGMFVKRDGRVLLQADQEGVTAVDVSVGNYLVIGEHARLEDFEGNRTACFWI